MENLIVLDANKHTVDYIRYKVKYHRLNSPEKKVQIIANSSWITFWQNERDFMSDEDKKWVSIQLID